MNLAGRIALSVGSIGAGALALQQLERHIHPGLDDRTKQAQAQTDVARAEWESWKQDVEAKFPGMHLDTPSDHQAFEQYLQDHPAPSWIQVSHDRYNHVHLEASSPLTKSVKRGPGEETGYPMVIGGLAALVGAMTAVMAIFPSTRPASTAGLLGMTLGGGAAILGGGALAIFSARGESNLDQVYGGAAALTREVNDASDGK